MTVFQAAGEADVLRQLHPDHAPPQLRQRCTVTDHDHPRGGLPLFRHRVEQGL
jgi:hypothetical protein